MKVNGTNNIQNTAYGCASCTPANPQQTQTTQVLQPALQCAPMQVNPPQNMQAPSTSGVHIQIINPSVTTAGAVAPSCNVNAPNYYPPNYYTDNIAQKACECSCDCHKNGEVSNNKNVNGTNNTNANTTNNTTDNTSNNTSGSPTNNTSNNTTNNTSGSPTNNTSNNTTNNTSGSPTNNTSNNTTNNTTNNTSGSPTNNATGNPTETSTDKTSVNNTEATSTTTNETKKTEKKKVVELTDQYIMNLENYLNSQDKDIRLSAAKEVYARLEEDPSRKDDKALTALINKMLQDPDSEVRMLALAALDGRYVQGDDYTVGLLQNMQAKPDGYGQDAIDAAEILLKMSGKQIEKEVEVDPSRQKKTVKTETKKETKKG